MLSAELGPKLEGYVAELVESGRYNSKSEVVREGTVTEIVAGHPAEITFRTPERDLPLPAGAEVSLALASVAADSLSSMVPGLFGGEQDGAGGVAPGTPFQVILLAAITL